MTSAITLGWRSFDSGQCKILVKAMTIHAWITKSVIGLFESQCVGLTPSNTPPCGVARSAPDVDEAVALTVRVTVWSTVTVTEAIFVETVYQKEVCQTQMEDYS